ncbi:unnamed protein product [Trichogramma brassicae]|uniref:Uncharacterized protein n=1 Tax=Trichogramma brassicae TaxID=86971 RepID=A0A6H5J386_9HYME|nr:unnamed protein product [Trichogramma brassicae]
MGDIKKPFLKKIPGEIPPQPKKANQGYIENLASKKKVEIEELLDRQNKLLANNFIAKLPDKGKKILDFKEKLEKELEHRNEIESAATLLSRLNIATEGKAAMAELEWTGKYEEKPENKAEHNVELDSDEEEDPLKIIAQPTGSGTHKKKIIHLPPEETSIKPEDLELIESFKKDPMELEHVKYIVNKVENPSTTNTREKFKPYKTTKSNVHDPNKEMQIEEKLRKNKHYELDAAHTPANIYGAAKMLDLHESLKLEKEQKIKLQQIQAKHAAERLKQHLGNTQLKIGDLPQDIGSYRSINCDNSDGESSSEEEEYDEVHDDEGDDRQGTVSFVVDTLET